MACLQPYASAPPCSGAGPSLGEPTDVQRPGGTWHDLMRALSNRDGGAEQVASTSKAACSQGGACVTPLSYARGFRCSSSGSHALVMSPSSPSPALQEPLEPFGMMLSNLQATHAANRGEGAQHASSCQSEPPAQSLSQWADFMAALKTHPTRSDSCGRATSVSACIRASQDGGFQSSNAVGSPVGNSSSGDGTTTPSAAAAAAAAAAAIETYVGSGSPSPCQSPVAGASAAAAAAAAAASPASEGPSPDSWAGFMGSLRMSASLGMDSTQRLGRHSMDSTHPIAIPSSRSLKQCTSFSRQIHSHLSSSSSSCSPGAALCSSTAAAWTPTSLPASTVSQPSSANSEKAQATQAKSKLCTPTLLSSAAAGGVAELGRARSSPGVAVGGVYGMSVVTTLGRRWSKWSDMGEELVQKGAGARLGSAGAARVSAGTGAGSPGAVP